MVGYDRNSTGKGEEQEAPSTALGLGMDQGSPREVNPSQGSLRQASPSQGSTSRVSPSHRNTIGVIGTTSSPKAPGSTHSFPPGATDGPLALPGQLLGNSTVEPPSWPSPTEDPTGHIMWHATRSTWETLLNPTWLQNEDSGPSGSVDLPSTPTLTPLKTPACGEFLEWCMGTRTNRTHSPCESLVAKLPWPWSGRLLAMLRQQPHLVREETEAPSSWFLVELGRQLGPLACPSPLFLVS